MELFLYWLLRASVLTALFYGLYKFFFTNNTFHNINRFSLICMLLLITALPLFRFNLIPAREAKPVASTTFLADFSSLPVMDHTEMRPGSEIPWIQIVLIVFAVGFLFTFIRYLIGVSQIAALIRKSEKQTLEDHAVLCVTGKNISPFSWMKYIVLSRKELSAGNQEVISHERAHAYLGHSFDMILFDIFTCLFWFNPFAWLLRREIQSVHEYQVDKQVLNQGVDARQYQLLLIRRSVGEYKFALANNFRRRDLHKRITMMMKNKTDKRMKWNYAIALPVLFLAVVALSVPELNAKAVEKENKEQKVTVTESQSDLKVTLEKGEGDTVRIKDRDDVEKVTVRTIGGKRPLYIIDGTITSEEEMQKLDPDNIESISVLKENSATDIYGEKGKDGVILIETKKRDRDAKETGSKSTELLRDSMRKLVVRAEENKVQYLALLSENSPLVIVDGEKMAKDFDLGSIRPDDIESVSILKDKNATEIYGDEAKNGVVIITKKTAGKELRK